MIYKPLTFQLGKLFLFQDFVTYSRPIWVQQKLDIKIIIQFFEADAEVKSA